ncbi:MAG: 50S ribosomal protein L35 [Candidatus Doudnabacteria bacterium]|nr:50S ribosomal protein L35 [Candidatus Doudnabacteria bacterium]
MPKVKTHKGASKRLRLTPTGKLMHRTMGQNHFNSREPGKVTKNKRRDQVLSESNSKLKSLIPYK